MTLSDNEHSEAPRSGPVSRDWEPFADALALALDVLDDSQFLVLSVKRGMTAGAAPTGYFMQFMPQGPFGLRAEAVSNSFLTAAEKLDDDQGARLVELGWRPPTGDRAAEAEPHETPDGSANFFLEWPRPVPYPEVGQLACDTLREVYGAAHPAQLSYRAFDPGGAQILLPTLGVRAEPPGPGHPPLAFEFATGAQFRSAVEVVIKQLISASELALDEDGDIPITHGSAIVYVRIVEEPPLVRLFTPILMGVSETLELLEELNSINVQLAFGRLSWSESAVVGEMTVFGNPLVPIHLANALALMTEMADDVDDDLQAKFGGRIPLGEAVPEKKPAYGGYL